MHQLISLFNRISDAPDATPRLRRFILNLAVRGKLVEQDPKDEPASKLLNRIQAGRARLVKAREKKKEPLPDISDDDRPFELPHGWCWVRFGEIFSLEYGDNLPAEKRSNTGEYPVYGSNGIVGSHSVCFVREPCIVVGRKGSAGALNLSVTEGCCVTDVAYYCIPPRELDLMFSFKLFHTLGLDTLGKGIKPGLNRNEVYVLPLVLPPLAEQHRIVAKLDELMALCDLLETSQAERESRRDRLAAASLHHLNNGADADAFRDHARFYFNRLPRLTTRSEHIQQLRQTILNLAVRGQLVPQDPNDELASELLKSIHRTRKHLRKFASLDLDELESPLPEIPSNWTWTVVDQIAGDDPNAITDGPFGANLKTEHYVTTPGYRVIRLQNIGRGLFHEEHRSYIDRSRFDRLSKHHVHPGDLVVAGLVDPFVRCSELPANFGPALVKADCYRFSVHPQACARFASHYLNSPTAQEFAAAHHHGMTLTRIGLGNFRRIPFPLPPLAEQHRIVAKVDELMALCGRLEAQLTTTQTESRRLLEAVLHEALSLRSEPEQAVAM